MEHGLGINNMWRRMHMESRRRKLEKEKAREGRCRWMMGHKRYDTRGTVHYHRR
jgi:hypothetical protein